MLGMIRMAGLGLCLGVGFLYLNASATVTAATPEPSAKAFPGRLAEDGIPASGAFEDARVRVGAAGKGDRLHPAACADQTWPYIAPDCLGVEAAPRHPVRTVTVSEPAGAGATLTRTPAVVVANR